MKLIYTFYLLIICNVANAQISFEATNDFGKLFDIKYDLFAANKLYALSIQNHILVSVNNGQTWQILYAYPNEKIQLSKLKIGVGGKTLTYVVKGNSNVQDDGIYIFSLINNTIVTHFTPPNWADNPNIPSYSIYDKNGGTILLHTSYSIGLTPFSKVFYSNTNGSTWSEVYFSGTNNQIQINNVTISPNDSSKLFLARGLGSQGVDGGLLVSNNAGIVFTEQLPNIILDPIEFSPTNANIILVGTSISFGLCPEAVYKSIDGAVSFDTLSIAWHDQILNNINVIKFDPVNNNTIWILEENEILKSIDAGITWTSKVFDSEDTTYAYGNSISISPFNSNNLFIANDAWPQYSVDGGNTLIRARNQFCLGVGNVSFGNYIGNKHLFYTNILGGYFDKNITTNSEIAYNIQSPFMVNIPQTTIFTDSTITGRIFTYLPSNDFGTLASLNYSNDYGATLHSIPTEDSSIKLNCIVKNPNQSNTYFVSYSSFSKNTLQYLDFSNNPIANNIATPEATFAVKGIYIPITSQNVIYVAQGIKVYKSLDFGNNWIEKINGLNLTYGEDIIFDFKSNPLNPNQFLATTSKGVYISNDSSENWHIVFPTFMAIKADFSTATNGHIIAFSKTSDNTETKIAYSQDGGQNWLYIIPTALQFISSNAVDFYFMPTAIDVFIGTNDLGVIKYQIKSLTNPLPVHLLSFSGKKNDNITSLEWKVMGENELLHYEIQRSTDGYNFQNITFINATNVATEHKYYYSDFDFITTVGTVFYRLKIVDIDNSYTYSSILKLNLNKIYKSKNINIYPNPANNQISIKISTASAEKYVVKIVDVSGKVVFINNYVTNDIINISLLSWSLGLYIISIENNVGEINLYNFIKQ